MGTVLCHRRTLRKIRFRFNEIGEVGAEIQTNRDLSILPVTFSGTYDIKPGLCCVAWQDFCWGETP